MPGLFDDIPYLSEPPQRPGPLQVTVTPQRNAQTGRGSWYSQHQGNSTWIDSQDRPGSNALGVPDEQQGVALPSRATLGKWFDVTGPDGTTHRLQQTDIGPAKWTGRGIDISAAAADSMGYSPGSFPTDARFSWRAAPGPPPATPIGSAQAGEAQAARPPKAFEPPRAGGLFDNIPYIDQAEPERQIGPAEALSTGLEQGLTMNFGDEIRGLRAAGGVGKYVPGTLPVAPAIESLAGLARIGYEYLAGGDEAAKRYASARDENREKVRLSEEQRPGMTLGGNLLGAVSLPIPGAVLARGAGLGTRAAASALTGGAVGAAAGAGEGEGAAGRLASAAQGAAGGAIIGAGIPVAAAPFVAAGRAAGRMLRSPDPALPGMEVAAAGQRVGVTLPRAVTNDISGVQQMGRTAAALPLAGDLLRRASGRAIGQLDDAVGRVEKGYGSGEAVQAGAAVREGITGYIKTDTARRADALYRKVDALVDPGITTPLNSTRDIANIIELRRSAAGLGESKAVQEVGEAVSRPKGLTYEGTKLLRTSIGEMLDTGLLPADTSKAELKQIYGALTKDLRRAVLEAGGDRAVSAFDRANRYYELVSNRREALAKVLGTRSDEDIFQKVIRLSSAGAGADISALTKVRKAIGPDGWNEVASAIVSRLGRDAAGNLTPDRFVTAFGKLSPEGKAMLFRSTGKAGLASALDDISTVMTRFKSLNQFANPSGTGQTVAGNAILAGGAAYAYHDPLGALQVAIPPVVVAALLARPSSARAIAKWVKSYEQNATARTPLSDRAMARATSTLSVAISQDVGRPELAGELMRSLHGVGPMRAGEQPQN